MKQNPSRRAREEDFVKAGCPEALIKDKNSGKSDGACWRGRGLCLPAGFALIGLAAGAAAGSIRHIVDFFPVLQGMAAGSAAGWASGILLIRGLSVRPKERAWLWLNTALVYMLSLGAVLGILNRRPFSPPLSWLKDVMTGAEMEYFFGAPIFSWGIYGGAISGAWWVFFNALDSVFFFFAGLIMLGVVSGRNPASRQVKTGGAGRFLIIQCLVVILAFSALAVQTGLRNRGPYASYGARIAARERLTAFEGKYVFEDGKNILEASGRGGVFTVEASGHDSLFLRGEPEDSYYISISIEGRYFRGRLYRGKSLERVFLKFAEDGALLISARRPVPGGGRADIMLEARKIR